MPSKTILNMDRAASRLLAAARDTQDEMLDAMERRLEQDGVRAALSVANEPVVVQADDTENVVLTAQAVAELQVPDLGQMVSFGVWMIDFYRKKMVEADEAHLRELQEDWKVREARDEAAADAYRDLVNVRGMMESALHPRVVESALGLQGATPSEPLALSKALRTAIDRLRERRSELPTIRIAGMAQDWDVLTAALEERRDALQAGIDAVLAEVEAAKRRRRAKERAVQDYRDAAVGWTGAVRGLLVAAGVRDAANELPATTPRRQASAVSDALSDEEEPNLGIPSPTEEPVNPSEEDRDDDLPTPANEPGEDRIAV